MICNVPAPEQVRYRTLFIVTKKHGNDDFKKRSVPLPYSIISSTGNITIAHVIPSARRRPSSMLCLTRYFR